MSEWETFCDECYYHLWRVRRKSERGFNDGFHLQHGEEAKELVELLNRLERERDEAREALRTLAEHGENEIQKLIKERDEARDELCHLRACVFDVMSALDAGAFTELRKAWEEGAK